MQLDQHRKWVSHQSFSN